MELCFYVILNPFEKFKTDIFEFKKNKNLKTNYDKYVFRVINLRVIA